MSVKKEPSGRRSVAVEVEVPGTPEEVWQAIATGPGVSAWFVPTEVRDDGTIVSNFGPGMESVATRTAWDPPRRFAAGSPGWGPGAPPMATEWVVEARAGGTCVVRVVHSLFAGTDDWDAQLEGTEHGWPWFFEILKLYLTHFRGERCATIRVMGAAPEPASAAWDAVTSALGAAGAIPRPPGHRAGRPAAPRRGRREGGRDQGPPRPDLAGRCAVSGPRVGGRPRHGRPGGGGVGLPPLRRAGGRCGRPGRTGVAAVDGRTVPVRRVRGRPRLTRRRPGRP